MSTRLAKEMLKRHEGLRLTVYECTAGKKTIGYGRNLEDKGITEAEAEFLLDNDIREIEERLSQAQMGNRDAINALVVEAEWLQERLRSNRIRRETLEQLANEAEAERNRDNDIQEVEERLSNFDFYSDLDANRKAALIDLAFNLGISGLKGFKKMLKALQEGDFREASIQLLDSKYARQVPNRAVELARIIEGGQGRGRKHA